MATNFKKKPARSPKYLAFIRQQPCCCTHETTGIDAHHQAKEGHGGKSTKPCDSRTIPLHWKVHHRMETPGNSRKSVLAKYCVDPEQVIAEMRAKYLAEGHDKFWEDD